MKTRGKYLLDTCVCIALIKGVPSVIDHIRKVGANKCRISEITLAELYFGAFKSGRKNTSKMLRKSKHFLNNTMDNHPAHRRGQAHTPRTSRMDQRGCSRPLRLQPYPFPENLQAGNGCCSIGISNGGIASLYYCMIRL